MSRPFSNYSAKPTFAQVNKSLYASDYIASKKTKYSFCNSNICYPNKNITSESNLLLLKKANILAFYPYNNFDKTQLYSNLYTKLDLSDLSGNISIISDLSGNTFPVIINTSVEPFLKYNIDPSGVLFGNTPCGIDNYLNYVVYDTSFNSISFK
jgi:hypothetical protein